MATTSTAEVVGGEDVGGGASVVVGVVWVGGGVSFFSSQRLPVHSVVHLGGYIIVCMNEICRGQVLLLDGIFTFNFNKIFKSMLKPIL